MFRSQYWGENEERKKGEEKSSNEVTESQNQCCLLDLLVWDGTAENAQTEFPVWPIPVIRANPLIRKSAGLPRNRVLCNRMGSRWEEYVGNQ